MTVASEHASPLSVAQAEVPRLAPLSDVVRMLSVVIAAAALLAIVALNERQCLRTLLPRQADPWAEEAMLYLMMLIVFSAVRGRDLALPYRLSICW